MCSINGSYHPMFYFILLLRLFLVFFCIVSFCYTVITFVYFVYICYISKCLYTIISLFIYN